MRKIPQRIAAIVSAWATHAPTETFGEMTLDQFITITADSLRAREGLDEGRISRAGMIADRQIADAVSLDKLNLVINSVAGHPDFGTGSPLWVAMGYEQTRDEAILMSAGLEAGEGYTPEDLGPRLWLDAARPGAIQSTHIRDRSIYGHDLFRFGGVTEDRIGGLPAVGLPSGSWLRTDSLFQNPAFTIALVIRHYSNDGIRHYFESGHTGLPVRIHLRHVAQDNTFQVLTRGINEGDGELEAIRVEVGSYRLGTEPNLIVIGSNASQSFVKINGGQRFTTGKLGAEGFRGLYIGRRFGIEENLWFNAAIGELILIPSTLSQTQLEKLEGYLFWKWLMVERIPSGHTYANAKPQKTS